MRTDKDIPVSGGTSAAEGHLLLEELTTLIEQLVVKLRNLCRLALPIYRAQIDEPALLDDQRVRIVSGLSGAGKTAWVAEAALHAPLPGDLHRRRRHLDQLSHRLSRARSPARCSGGRAGSSVKSCFLVRAALDMLGALSARLGEEGVYVHVVIDNTHRVPASDIEAIVARAPHLRFLLLGSRV